MARIAFSLLITFAFSLLAPAPALAQIPQSFRGGRPVNQTTHAAAAPWWKHAVIYEIYPRSFQDSNGDGIGDLNGITGRLEHIASLGVDAIWLSPFFASPMKDFGYDVSDYRAVDPIFGSLADFDRL